MEKNNLITLAQEFMKTTITISVVQEAQARTIEIQDAIHAAFGEFDRVVKKFTRFNEDSELSNLNRNNGNWCGVSAEMFMLMETMLQLAKDSQGAFDPTVIDFLETYGYDPKYDFSKLNNPDLDNNVKKIASTRHSWQDIELDKPNLKIKLMPGQRIDLGGIGKGYAIDLAYDKLNKYANFLIDAGGDIRTKGKNAKGELWSLNLLHKNKPNDNDKSKDAPTEVIGNVKISDLAIACSGSWARRVKQFHHILNPVTGAPVETMQTVYVSAQNATLADGWATALFVGGTELLGQIDKEVGVLMIDDQGKAISTPTFPKIN